MKRLVEYAYDGYLTHIEDGSSKASLAVNTFPAFMGVSLFFFAGEQWGGEGLQWSKNAITVINY